MLESIIFNRCDNHTNHRQERNKYAQWKRNIRLIQVLYTTIGYEGDGVTGPRETKKITKEGGTTCSKLGKRKRCGRLEGRTCAYDRQIFLYAQIGLILTNNIVGSSISQPNNQHTQS